jgi:hypothetical protein
MITTNGYEWLPLDQARKGKNTKGPKGLVNLILIKENFL